MTNLNESMTSVSLLAMTPGANPAKELGRVGPILVDTDMVQVAYRFEYNKFDPSLSDLEQAKVLINSMAAAVVFLGMVVDASDAVALTNRYINELSDPDAQEWGRTCIVKLQTSFDRGRAQRIGIPRLVSSALGIALFVEVLDTTGYASMSPTLDVAQIHLVDDLEFLMPGLIMVEAPSAAITPPPNIPPSKPAPLVDNIPTAATTVGTALENWIGTKGSKSEIARKRSAAELFLKSANVSLDMSVDALAALTQPDAKKFVRLIEAVGPGFGQAAHDRHKTADELIALCTGSTPPTWSLRPRTAAGNARRIAYAKRFLDYVSAHHVPVPHPEWHWV
jgi:hypothetical protein